MLHAASPPPVAASQDPPTARQSPAASFFSRLNAPRSTSYDAGIGVNASAPSGSDLGFSSHVDSNGGGSGAGPGPSTVAASDLRRATSLRTAGVFGGAGRETVSFTAAGSDLSSPSAAHLQAQVFTPPAASRHPLFSHHALPPGGSSGAPSSVSDNVPSSPHFMSDPGPSGPPSPTPSDISSSAFSPASAFLSAFSSSNSLRAPTNIAPDAAGARVLDYTLGKIVGRGGFSTVRKATHVSTGGVMACKIVKRDDLSDRSGSLEKFEDEIRLWKGLPAHPSLLPLIEMHRTPYATFLIMPYLPGGSLLDVLQREGGSDKTARTWFPGVVAAVSALHEGFPGFEGGLLHGDLKLDNFLVDHSGGVMVCDFYMAQKINVGGGKEDRLAVPTIPPPLSSDRSHSRGRNPDHSPLGRHSTLPAGYHRGPRMSSPLPGSRSHRAPNEHSMPDPILLAHSEKPFPSASLPYAPPELLRAPPSGPSLAQDVWAVGIILYALLTSKLPFVDAFDPRLQMKILRGTWEEPPFLTREWAECLHGCLDGNRDTRWTIGRVKQSDAVTGWKEVQSRSKSRSRSRARVPVGDGLLDPLRRMSQDAGTQAVPISPFPRGRNRKHSTSSGASRSRSRSVYQNGAEGYHPGESSSRDRDRDRGRDIHRDMFAPLAPTTLRVDVRAGSKTPRSRSASASRSRSSGNDHRPMFTLDAPDLVRSLEGVDINRGRSVKRDVVPGLQYARQSSEVSANVVSGLPIPGQGYPNSKSNSRSRSRQRLPISMQPSSAPAYPVSLSTFGSSSFSTTNSGLPSPSPRGTSASRSSRTSESPSAGRGGRSMSRSRDSPVWDNHLMLDRYEYGKELELVHEEDRGRTGRSRSRGRRGRSGAPGPGP
ncbi:CAMK protein kinase [Kwoniella heveanensis BCC8398]|uniref:CAMK protein kinase n=1 Tax=Kwoniella heveanensis BCC8398 TaxID=1296120 RepID=A0A1B9GR98_9TREE|nr:CAMK protein kinase [Kwoniella heveanensis BCC8398]